MFKLMKGFRTKFGSTLLGACTVLAAMHVDGIPPLIPAIGQGLGVVLTAVGIRYGNDPTK